MDARLREWCERRMVAGRGRVWKEAKDSRDWHILEVEYNGEVWLRHCGEEDLDHCKEIDDADATPENLELLCRMLGINLKGDE